MRCEQCREALSARLDGEESPEGAAATDAHLRECGECRRWLDDATRLTRLARMSVVTTVPAIGDEVLAAIPEPAGPTSAGAGPARARLAGVLWVALALVGGSQLFLGLVQMTTSLPAAHLHGTGPAAGSHHLWTESAAWNMAIGAGFLWTATRRVAASALIPVLTAFVALLALLSANDLWSGRVETERLLSHGLVIAGYVILMALTRPTLRGTAPPSGQDRGTSRWRIRFDEPDAPAGPPLRALRSPSRQWARHDRAAQPDRAA
jgi:predicted anti-sigma-YlaC factor YlaD